MSRKIESAEGLNPLSTLLRWRSHHPAMSSSCLGTSAPKPSGESSACQKLPCKHASQEQMGDGLRHLRSERANVCVL